MANIFSPNKFGVSRHDTSTINEFENSIGNNTWANFNFSLTGVFFPKQESWGDDYWYFTSPTDWLTEKQHFSGGASVYYEGRNNPKTFYPNKNLIHENSSQTYNILWPQLIFKHVIETTGIYDNLSISVIQPSSEFFNILQNFVNQNINSNMPLIFNTSYQRLGINSNTFFNYLYYQSLYPTHINNTISTVNSIFQIGYGTGINYIIPPPCLSGVVESGTQTTYYYYSNWDYYSNKFMENNKIPLHNINCGIKIILHKDKLYNKKIYYLANIDTRQSGYIDIQVYNFTPSGKQDELWYTLICNGEPYTIYYKSYFGEHILDGHLVTEYDLFSTTPTGQSSPVYNVNNYQSIYYKNNLPSGEYAIYKPKEVFNIPSQYNISTDNNLYQSHSVFNTFNYHSSWRGTIDNIIEYIDELPNGLNMRFSKVKFNTNDMSTYKVF